MANQALFLSFSFIALGLIIVIIGTLNLGHALQSQHWPVSTGQVDSAKIIHMSDAKRYLPQVSYHYTVDKITYSGSRLSLREPDSLASPDIDQAQAVLARYPAGQSIQVFYDPADPARSILEPGTALPSYLAVGAGGFFFIIGLILGLFALITP